MTKIFFTSLALALILGFTVSLATTAVFTQVSSRYEPPLTPNEVHLLSQLPPARAQEALAGRIRPYTKSEWLHDAFRDAFFWKQLAARSVIPALGIFFACMLVGAFARLDATASTK